MQEEKSSSRFRVCRVYFFLFLVGMFMGAGYVWTSLLFGNSGFGLKSLQAAESRQPISAAQDNSALQAPGVDSGEAGAQEEGNSQAGNSQAAGAGESSQQPSQPSQPGQPAQTAPQAPLKQSGGTGAANAPSDLESKRITVLLVGVDRRPGEISLSNTDTLIVASINPATGKAALLSIPRDTQIVYPGHGKVKINSVATLGNGLTATTQVIENLIGEPIDGYVLTNFSGFKGIIDTLGGITINVEKDMYYVTGDKNDGVINLKKGLQHMQGAQALQYARFRQDALADISRTSRQQAVLKAIGKEFLQLKTIPKLPWLIPQLTNAVETNLSLRQIWTLADTLLYNRAPEIAAQTLPGNFLTENGISYWQVDGNGAKAVVKRLFTQGKTTSVFNIP